MDCNDWYVSKYRDLTFKYIWVHLCDKNIYVHNSYISCHSLHNNTKNMIPTDDVKQ